MASVLQTKYLFSLAPATKHHVKQIHFKIEFRVWLFQAAGPTPTKIRILHLKYLSSNPIACRITVSQPMNLKTLTFNDSRTLCLCCRNRLMGLKLTLLNSCAINHINPLVRHAHIRCQDQIYIWESWIYSFGCSVFGDRKVLKHNT